MNARRWLVVMLVVGMLTVRSSMATDSKSATEAVEKGKTSLDTGNFDKAISDLTEAIQLDPKLADNCRKIRSWNK